MAERALLSLKTWGDAAPNVGNLSIDPHDKEYFFRKNHAVTNVAKDRPTVANENEKLYGMSPMCYWEFREQSQDLRMVLHLQVYQRDLALDPVHVDRDEEEVKQSVGKLKGMAV
ncbi:hypothetical protein N0V91_006582 [Didymella pomorum]|uniref:Uncharacterized protein n=1 Tax=Didymella pomorum TaxID=749634 RepID=A0A9W8ZC63_9PLEO|nr:hypothetical protein N0V91_006582 [Didymella pomorum]